MATAMDLGFPQVVPRYFFYIAFVAWGITFIGLLGTMARTLIKWPGGR
jgi:hypothetical protein